MRKIVFIIRIFNNIRQYFKVTSVPFFIPNFKLLSCELGSFTLKWLYLGSFYFDNIIEQNKSMEHIHNTLTALCEKS